MDNTVKQALYGLALVLVLALPGCAGSALISAQGPAVGIAALNEVSAAEQAAVQPPAPEPAVPGAAGSQTAPDPAETAPPDGELSVAPGLTTSTGGALQALAIWSGLQQLRDTLLEGPVHLAVPNILQNPELPNGCEITSAAIALNYLGVPADKIELARDYLPQGAYYRTSDPEKEYMGSPFAGKLGDYCMPPPVVKAVNDYLADVGRTDLRAKEISGADLAELGEYLHAGTPVLVWVTQHFEEPRYAWYFTLPDGGQPYDNLHCVVLTGVDEDRVYLTDPLAQAQSVDKETFAHIYEAMGSRALVIKEK